MARITDNTKIEAVKKTLINIIVEDGSNHASIAKMAKTAGVSSGYLYRHYDSKESLLTELYTEKFLDLNEILLNEIEKSQSLQCTISAFYRRIVELAKSNENEILFFLKMMTDYSMKISNSNRVQMLNTVQKFKNKYDSELNTDITFEQIFTQVLGTILLFINMRKRSLFSTSTITEEEINVLTQMALNALK